MGVAKWRIIRTIGSSTRQKLQNSKGYAESPEFSPALGLIIFGENCHYKFEVN